MDRDKFEINWTTLWRIFLMAAFVAALFLAREALIILFLAIVISSALDGPVNYLERKKIPRILGTLFIFICAISILVVLLYTLIPITIFEFQNLLDNLKKIEIPVFGHVDISQFIGLNKYLANLGNLADVLFSGGISFFNVLTYVFGNLALILATLILSFYLAINRSGVERFLRAVLPITQEEYIIDLYHRVRKKLGLWLQGQLFLMLVIGVVTSLGLWILGVKYSLVLGIFAALMELVPLVGPIFIGALSFLVAITDSWTLGIYVIVLFLVIQQLEGHILVPIVMKKAVGISPVMVVVALLAGSEIAGFVGIILAVPAAVIFQEIILDYERKKTRTQQLKIGK